MGLSYWRTATFWAGSRAVWKWGRVPWGIVSILANPGDAAMKDRVNNRVKHREDWRPFGPSVVVEQRERYFPTSISAPFMTMALPTTPAGRRDLSAAMHVDATARARS